MHQIDKMAALAKDDAALRRIGRPAALDAGELIRAVTIAGDVRFFNVFFSSR